MIRPEGKIEYPPSEFIHMKASMLARMESLNSSTDNLMGIIARRLGAEQKEDFCRVEELTAQQDQLIKNMRKLARA
jgi:hypothetical protein